MVRLLFWRAQRRTAYNVDGLPFLPLAQWLYGSGHCGAGTEGDLVWAKLVGRRAVVLRSAPYASCWRDIGTQDDEHPAYSIDRDSLWMDEQLVAGGGRVRIRYWFRDPVQGMEAIVDTARVAR